jgi:endonuclease/exonuclease/phosphatase family metal-dependent hydrolase
MRPPSSLAHRARFWLLFSWSIWLSVASLSSAQTVFINELHYENAGNDAGEGIEIAGPAGTNLADYSLVFYNGSSNTGAAPLSGIGTINLTGVIDDLGVGYGVEWFDIAGIENGASDGVALYRKSTAQVVQFLSWEGVAITGGAGVANGMTSVKIPYSESDSTPQGFSLQLKGTGAAYPDFTWVAAANDTPGLINNLQTLGSVVYSSSLGLSILAVDETAGSSTVVATVQLSPPPTAPRTITLTSSDGTEATVPTSVNVGTTGSATFPVTVINDGVVDGNQVVTISMSDGLAVYPTKSINLTVRDVDAPAPAFTGVLRVACLNVLFGVNTPGSAAYNAVRDELARIDPQVIGFEEVDAANNFAEMKSLLNELGFLTSNLYFAANGIDPATGQSFTSYVPGDAGATTQCVCLASKFPINLSSVRQINRGVAGRAEMARYPLFVTVDVPGVPAESDPAFVVVHLKASGTEPDRFRRAVETYRITQFLTSQGYDGLTKNVFLLGDFNEGDDQPQTASFFTGINTTTYTFSDGEKLPASFVLGADIAGTNGITLPYDRFPHAALAAVHVTAPETKQADGSTRATYNAVGNARLDYIYAPTPITTAGLYASEIYNSRLETAFDGMPKAGSAPAADTSFIASDHFAVFADVALGAMPKLSLTPSVAFVNEAITNSLTLNLTLSQAPGVTPVTVHLSAHIPGRIALPVSSVTFTGSQTTAQIPVAILHPSAVDPHRIVTVSATASGWFNGKATFEIRNQEAGGQVVVSQYLEPANSTTPKAIELWNQSGSTIDFSRQPLTVKRYTNGDTVGVNEAKVTIGTLDANQVLVIGDSVMGEYLLAQGIILADLLYSPTTAPTGTPFYDALGNLRFWKDSFTYNGNDALEVLFNYTRMDVFGTIGQDPGTAWTGGGVSTINQSIELKSCLGTGTTGFVDPSMRFVTVSTTDALTGFGIAPTVSDLYLQWATAQSLSGLHRALLEDPDGDGLSNLLEYAVASAPTLGSGNPLSLVGNLLQIRVRVPGGQECLAYSLEYSTDLLTWNSASLIASVVDVSGGMQTMRWTLPVTAGGHGFYRFLVKR